MYYHYTSLAACHKILKSRYIQARTYSEHLYCKSVWFTKSTTIDPSLRQNNALQSFASNQFGVVRFQLIESPYSSVKLLSWEEFCAGRSVFQKGTKPYILDKMRRVVENKAAFNGANPREHWFISLKDVPVYSCEPPQILNGTEWIGLE